MVGVIADDLTGAAELGAVGLRHGLKAEIVLSGAPSGEADLVCVDTDSRYCEPEEAGRRAVAGARLLTGAGVKWFYKKVDSVLRGEVTAEVEALMRELGRDVALLVPANPSLGRVIRDGQYLIRGVPIHQTEFVHDPGHPRRSARVLDLVRPPVSCGIEVRHVRQGLAASGIVLGEAETPEDLRQWAACGISKALLAGGAEFFAALLAATGHAVAGSAADAEAGAHPGRAGGGELFVCGSTSLSSREFVRAARERGGPVVSLPDELGRGGDFTDEACGALARQAVAALRTHKRVVLNVGLPPVRERAVAARLAVQLVQLAEAVLRKGGAARVYAEGGATAAELVRRMGWKRLRVLREMAPGVAMLEVQGAPPLTLILKPGTYVWPEGVRKGVGL